MPRRPTIRLRASVLDALRGLSAASDLLDAAVGEHLALHRTDMRCLDFLSRVGPVTAGRLGHAVGLTSGALTIAVDRLERGGYVERHPDPTDRRRVLIGLGPCAERVVALFERLRRTTLRQLARYSDAELELVDTFLRNSTLTLEDQARAIRTHRAGHR